MKLRFLAPLLLFLTSFSLAQTTSVTLQVTDTDSQTWNNGTYSVTLIPGTGVGASGNLNGVTFRNASTGVLVPNQLQTGSLNASGGASLTLTQNVAIAPGGSVWAFTVCPQATASCFIQQSVIFGVSQTVTITPSAIRISLINPPPNVTAYADAEIINQVPGSQYYNLTSSAGRQWSGSVWTASGGLPAGCTGTQGNITCAIFSANALQTTALATPGTPVVTCAGACAGGTWGYRIAALDGNATAATGNGAFTTTRSAQGTATNATTLTSVNSNTITWTAVPGAASYNVYRTTSAGTPANLSLVCAQTTALTCLDDGSVNTASATTPTFNSTGGIKSQCSFSSNDVNLGLFPVPTGIGNGHTASGICFDSGGNMWWINPGHTPSAFFAGNINLKWSVPFGWAPNGTFPDAGGGVSLTEDEQFGGASVGTGGVAQPAAMSLGWNASQDGTTSYLAYSGSVEVFTCTNANLSMGQVVKVDASNAQSVVVAATTDTGGGIAIGIMGNGCTSPSGKAYVITHGIITASVIQPILGTGTCTLGQFVIVDTTTAGRVKCTSTYTAGTEIGIVTTAQASVGSGVQLVVQLR